MSGGRHTRSKFWTTRLRPAVGLRWGNSVNKATCIWTRLQSVDGSVWMHCFSSSSRCVFRRAESSREQGTACDRRQPPNVEMGGGGLSDREGGKRRKPKCGDYWVSARSSAHEWIACDVCPLLVISNRPAGGVAPTHSANPLSASDCGRHPLLLPIQGERRTTLQSQAEQEDQRASHRGGTAQYTDRPPLRKDSTTAQAVPFMVRRGVSSQRGTRRQSSSCANWQRRADADTHACVLLLLMSSCLCCSSMTLSTASLDNCLRRSGPPSLPLSLCRGR